MKKKKLAESVKIETRLETRSDYDVQVSRGVDIRLRGIQVTSDLSDKWYDLLVNSGKENREELRDLMEQKSKEAEQNIKERINKIDMVLQTMLQGIVHDASEDINRFYDELSKKFGKSGDAQ